MKTLPGGGLRLISYKSEPLETLRKLKDFHAIVASSIAISYFLRVLRGGEVQHFGEEVWLLGGEVSPANPTLDETLIEFSSILRLCKSQYTVYLYCILILCAASYNSKNLLEEEKVGVRIPTA